jgi:hypothetical protein
VKPFHLTTEFLEICSVEVWIDPPRSGGEFQVAPDEKGLPRLTVGFDLDERGPGSLGWVMGVLLHETLEFILHSRRCRFTTSGDNGLDHSEYTFHMNHPLFSHACATAGWFIENVRPAIKRAHAHVAREWRKQRKEKQ